MTQRLLFLQALLLLGLACVFLLPTKTGLGPAGIVLALPDAVGEWRREIPDAPVTQAEREGLAPDTEFARRKYHDAAGHEIYVSIVLSGTDMANSIHRPERCLKAQGWTVERAERVQISLPAGTPPLAVTKLSDERPVVLQADAKPIAWRNLNYYWFVGSHDVTCSHWQRTFLDVKDRLLHGEAQRWAYVTVAASVTDNLRPQGGLAAPETARLAEDFIARIVPEFQRP